MGPARARRLPQSGAHAEHAQRRHPHGRPPARRRHHRRQHRLPRLLRRPNHGGRAGEAEGKRAHAHPGQPRARRGCGSHRQRKRLPQKPQRPAPAQRLRSHLPRAQPRAARIMMTLEIRHLLLVAAVSEEGTLTKASTRLHPTQSALSHQLLDLEERLGTQLFHRVSKRMILTAAGERILASAKRVLDDLRHAEEEVRLLVEEKRGLLRITTECYTCYHWLPALLARFRKKHPGVDVRIDIASTKRPFDALVEGSIDLALVSEEVDDKRLRVTPLFDDEQLVMAPDHPLAGREAI